MKHVQSSFFDLVAWKMLGKLRRRVAQLFLRVAFLVLERVIPKDDAMWCFCTWDKYYHTLDNPRALFEAIRLNSQITSIILQKSSGVIPHEERKGRVKFVKAESLQGAFYLARSRVVILAYSLRGMSSYAHQITKAHFVVQLWHGIPIRPIGKMFVRETWWNDETEKYSMMVASSRRERTTLSAAFAPLRPDQIIIHGLPRNDFIQEAENELPDDYASELARLRHTIRGRKLILYAPTWRDEKDSIYQFSTQEERELSLLLRQNGALLGIRAHANVRDTRVADQYCIDEIVTLNDYPDVNLILRETALLITDYSSISLDFVLTGRPIVHFAYDYEHYIKTRTGFLYPEDECFPGVVVGTFEELIAAMRTALSSRAGEATKYARVRELSHEHGRRSGDAVAQEILQRVHVDHATRGSVTEHAPSLFT